MLRSITVLATLVTLAWVDHSLSQCVPPPGPPPVIESFSSLAIVGGLQYPSGMQLILKENGSRVEAVLRDYAGEENPQETKLTGTIKGKKSDGVTTCEVDLTGAGKHGVVEIHGAIKGAYFSGTIGRHLGRDLLSQRISLKRRPLLDIEPAGAV